GGAAERKAACDDAFAAVEALASDLERAGLPRPRIVAGGSPTFPFHALRPDVECSPGTCVFWDAGYAANVPDLPFEPAVALLTRVVSPASPSRICVDLGHKAVGSEMPHPRAVFPALPGARAVSHSEEHLVLEMPEPSDVPVGAMFTAIPWHVCPTVALHSEAWIVREGVADDRWPVSARRRRLTV